MISGSELIKEPLAKNAKTAESCVVTSDEDDNYDGDNLSGNNLSSDNLSGNNLSSDNLSLVLSVKNLFYYTITL